MNYKQQLDKVKELGISVHDLNVGGEVERLNLGEEDFEHICTYVAHYDLKSCESILVEIVDKIEYALSEGVGVVDILGKHWTNLHELIEYEEYEDEEDYLERIFNEVQNFNNDMRFWKLVSSDNRDCTSEEVEWVYGTEEQAKEYNENLWESRVMSAIENFDYEREYGLDDEEEPTEEMQEEAQHDCEEAIEYWHEGKISITDISHYICGGGRDFEIEVEDKALELGIIQETRLKGRR